MAPTSDEMGTDNRSGLGSSSQEALDDISETIHEIDDPRELCESTYSALEMILNEESDRTLLVSLSVEVGEIIGDIPFDAPPDLLKSAIRAAARHCLRLLQGAMNAKAKRSAVEPPEDTSGTADPGDAANAETEAGYYYLPPNLAYLLKRIEYIAPPPPEPRKGFSTFDEFCEAAIYYKIDSVLVFFHRNNPSLIRELPPPYLLSPEFSVNLKRAIKELILPIICGDHQVRILSTSADWARIDTEKFWDNHTTKLIRRKIMHLWKHCWNELRLIHTVDEAGERTIQIKENTKILRKILTPSTPSAYDIPRVTNREITVFESFLDAPIDLWPTLTAAWQRCQDFYEQERDQRVYQQKAREGVLRDCLLDTFRMLPEHWNDFIVILCHRIFPRITTDFLEKFSMSVGRDEADREARIPHLMRYLRQMRGHPEIKLREQKEEEDWKAQAQELRNYLTGRKMEPG